tara:strand:+ start:278 stop:1285 length:1008 start_codon:yes stop_codon:yes gene_type:complete
MKPKVFITGITGMVGSHLADYISNNTDWEIHGLCRWRSPLINLENHIENINNGKNFFLHYGDLRDPLSIKYIIKKIKPDYCFHLAAQSFPKTSFESPLDTYETNIQGTETVLDSLKTYSPEAIIHVCSSSEVFGKVPREKLPINEECSFHPASPYAISKVSTDLIARYYAEAYNMTVMSTRMFTHTGPRRGDVFAESTFAKQIALIESKKQEPVIKVGNLKSLRTWADVRDAVIAYYKLVTDHPIPGAYYNIGGTFSCTIEEMLQTLINISGIKVKIEIDQNRIRPIDADLQVPDTTKFTNHTGWKPIYSFEQTMTDLLNYWRQRVNNDNAIINR